jgi:hypothetical protein
MSVTERPERTDSDDARQIWLDVVAAVEYLARGPRWGFTIWDAFEEAIRWWIIAYVDRTQPAVTTTPSWDDPDPLRTVVGMTLVELPSAGIDDGWQLADALQLALAQWTDQMADLYNQGRHWQAPTDNRARPALPVDPDRFITAADPLLDND